MHAHVQIELAMIDILEVAPTSADSGAEDPHAILERLQLVEVASGQVVKGIQGLTETMQDILEKQQRLETSIIAGESDQGTCEVGMIDKEKIRGSTAIEVETITAELAAWRSEVERAVKLATDAFAHDSPFVTKQNLEELQAACLDRFKDLQVQLNEGAGLTPRSFMPIEESTRRSQVALAFLLPASPHQYVHTHKQERYHAALELVVCVIF